MSCLNKIRFSYMLKFSFHSAINLPEYESLANETLDLWPVVDTPISLNGTSGVSSWSTSKKIKGSGTLLLDDVVALF